MKLNKPNHTGPLLFDRRDKEWFLIISVAMGLLSGGWTLCSNSKQWDHVSVSTASALNFHTCVCADNTVPSLEPFGDTAPARPCTIACQKVDFALGLNAQSLLVWLEPVQTDLGTGFGLFSGFFYSLGLNFRFYACFAWLGWEHRHPSSACFCLHQSQGNWQRLLDAMNYMYRENCRLCCPKNAPE